MFQKLITELKERKVIQRLTIYLGGWWVSIEVTNFLTDRFEWDTVWVKSLTILGAVLIPSVLILSWFGLSTSWWRKQLIFYIVNTIVAVAVLYSTNFTKSKNTNKENTIAPVKSIAVLPFANLSGDKGKEYFSDGLADEMISLLSRVPSLIVKGRQSSFQFKGANQDPIEIGKKLGVANLLDGSVRQTDERVKVSVSLINATNGSIMWSASYERKNDEVLKIQDDIALVVVSQLKIAMLEGLAKSPTVNNEAFDFYLKGKDAWNQRRLKESEGYFIRAIKIDSLFAPAYAGLAEVYMIFPNFGAGTPLESYPKAKLYADRAIQLDNSLSVPFLVLAMKELHFDLNLESAKKNFELAISKNPDYALNHYLYGHLLGFQSKNQEALAETQTGIELEPLSPLAISNMGLSLLKVKKYRDAIKYFEYSIELSKGRNSNAYMQMGNCLMELGKLKEAEQAYKKSSEFGNDRGMACLINYYMKAGNMAEANETYSELVNLSKKAYVSNVTLACAASFIGKKDETHALLTKAFEMQDSWLLSLLEYPSRQPKDIFTDPRNVELYKKRLPIVLVREGIVQ